MREHPELPRPLRLGEFRGVGPDRIGRAPGRRIHGVGDLHAAWCRPARRSPKAQPLGWQAGRAAPLFGRDILALVFCACVWSAV